VLVGAAAVVVEAAVVEEEDATKLTYTAPVWKQMDRGREHQPIIDGRSFVCTCQLLTSERSMSHNVS